MGDTYILYATYYSGDTAEHTTGNLWAVLYSIMYLSKHADTYRISIKTLHLYKLIGSHDLIQGQS